MRIPMLVVALIIILLLTPLLLLTGPDGNGPYNLEEMSHGGPVCFTTDCHVTSAILRDNMDSSVNPCRHFYEFACGNYVNSAIHIPIGESHVDYFMMYGNLVREQLKTLLEIPVQENEFRHFALVKNFYKKCMDQAAIDADGFTTVKDVLGKLGGWPVVNGDDWDEDSFDWKDFVYKSRRMGYDSNMFMDIKVSIDPTNSSKHVIVLAESSGLLRKGLMPILKQHYQNQLVLRAKALGANNDNRTINDIQLAVQFETALSDATENVPYKSTNLASLQETYPGIPWADYVSNCLNMANIASDEVILLSSPSYFRELQRLLTSSSKRVLANYVFGKIVSASAPYITKSIGHLKSVAGTRRTCVESASLSLPEAASAMYVRAYTSEKDRTDAAAMMRNIRNAVHEQLESAYWLDAVTRTLALEKLKTTTSSIGYPDELLNNEKLEIFFSNVELSSSYLQSKLNINKFKMDMADGLLRQPVDQNHWTLYPPAFSVYSYYHAPTHNIIIPAGILQGIFYAKNRPKYANYGAAGFIMANQITHAFDSEGSSYNEHPNYVNWWSAQNEQLFNEKSQFWVDQYNKYTVPNTRKNLDSARTLTENIADNGGIRWAYLAYNDWVKENGPEQSLPDMEGYTPRQMFWISAATMYCEKVVPEDLQNNLKTRHVPSMFRIQESLSNNKDFARDFKCPLGSPMNPKRKFRAL